MTYPNLTEEQTRELVHWSHFGSDGAPVTKAGSGWHVEHFPKTFQTKRAAMAAWESYIDALIDRKAGRS